jgi:hypothetical protein
MDTVENLTGKSDEKDMEHLLFSYKYQFHKSLI